jgi:isopentenyl-diphosphate delta-isomerase
MFEEMGMDITPEGLRHLFDFTYRAELDNRLIEHEYDSVFVYTTPIKPVPNPEEVMDWRYIDMRALEEELAAQPESYTPWFRIIFEQAKQHLYKYEGVSA